MANEPEKREIRLMFQGSIPVPDIQSSEDLYEQLKNLVKTTSPKSTLNGQVIKMLEPCCGDRKVIPYVQNRPLIP
jgi:hypothetical protein